MRRGPSRGLCYGVVKANNGAVVAEEPQIIGDAVGIAGDVTIGFWQGAYGFTGVIDEVRIWNTVRTPSEIAAEVSSTSRELRGL